MLVSRVRDSKSFYNSVSKSPLLFGKFVVILQRQLIISQKSKVRAEP